MLDEIGDIAGLAYTSFSISSVYYEKKEFDPILDHVGEDELMRLWQKMAVKKGIVEEV